MLDSSSSGISNVVPLVLVFKEVSGPSDVFRGLLDSSSFGISYLVSLLLVSLKEVLGALGIFSGSFDSSSDLTAKVAAATATAYSPPSPKSESLLILPEDFLRNQFFIFLSAKPRVAWFSHDLLFRLGIPR